MVDIEKIIELSEVLREIRACIARSELKRNEREKFRMLISACRLYDKLTVGLKEHGIRYQDIGTHLVEMFWIVGEIRYFKQQPMKDLLRELSD
jgi:hypothetical protein